MKGEFQFQSESGACTEKRRRRTTTPGRILRGFNGPAGYASSRNPLVFLGFDRGANNYGAHLKTGSCSAASRPSVVCPLTSRPPSAGPRRRKDKEGRRKDEGEIGEKRGPAPNAVPLNASLDSRQRSTGNFDRSPHPSAPTAPSSVIISRTITNLSERIKRP